MKYYIKCKGRTFGPTDENKIKHYVKSGFFSSDSIVSTDLKSWLPFQDVIEIEEESIVDSSPELSADESGETSKVFRLTEDNVVDKKSKKRNRTALPLGRRKAVLWGTCSFIVIALLAGGGYFFFQSDTIKIGKIIGKSPVSFQQVCQKHQSAVGLVVVTLEDAERKLLNYNGIDLSQIAMGTAFAIGKNQFATNSHVAYAIQDPKWKTANAIMDDIVKTEAKKQGVRNLQDYDLFLKNNPKLISEIKKFVLDNVRVRNVEIRLAHSGGRAISVTGVQIHPRYRTSGFSSDQEYFRNSEFDVAIFTTATEVNNPFSIASRETLYALAPGHEIAYIGFPTEGLMLEGNLDINNPEAVLKQGTINKITDFNNVFSTSEFNKSIIHDIPVTGGASGSPIFLPNGEIVALLWGGNVHGKDKNNARIVSAALHNFAVRVDALDIVKEQKIHDLKEWLGEKK